MMAEFFMKMLDQHQRAEAEAEVEEHHQPKNTRNKGKKKGTVASAMDSFKSLLTRDIDEESVHSGASGSSRRSMPIPSAPALNERPSTPLRGVGDGPTTKYLQMTSCTLLFNGKELGKNDCCYFCQVVFQ